MQVVIDIDEITYKLLCHSLRNGVLNTWEEIIAKGTPLPKTPLDEENCSNDNVQNCFNEILDYMNDKSVTWRDISDDIINDILKKYGFKQE